MLEVHMAFIWYGAADHVCYTLYFLPARRQSVLSEPAGHMCASMLYVPPV